MTAALSIPRRCDGVDCVSDFEMDALVGGFLTPSEGADVERRVGACERCVARLAEIRAEAAAFAKRPIPLDLVRKSRAHRRPWWIVSGGTVAVLAAAAALVIALRPQPTEEPDTRTKGAEHVGFDIVDPSGRIVGSDAEPTARPGDELQWRFHLHGPREVAVLSRDGGGTVSVYFPAAGTRTVRVTPEGRAKTATLLDGVLGREDLFMFLCDEPTDLTKALSELKDHGEFPTPPTCSVRHVGLMKVAP